ncbi:hypothetical protein KAI19_04210, partial [bacterium]|nr:hypothetical protein [bacterium]
ASHDKETEKVAQNNAEELLQFLDDTKPVIDLVRVLESKNELTDSDENNWTNWAQHKVGEDSQPFSLDFSKYGKIYVEGKVSDEYLPATTRVYVDVFKFSDDLNEFDFSDTIYTNRDKSPAYLKPYANQEPAPAGFREIVYLSKDTTKIPENGEYLIRTQVENLAGLRSDVKEVALKLWKPVELGTTWISTGIRDCWTYPKIESHLMVAAISNDWFHYKGYWRSEGRITIQHLWGKQIKKFYLIPTIPNSEWYVRRWGYDEPPYTNFSNINFYHGQSYAHGNLIHQYPYSEGGENYKIYKMYLPTTQIQAAIDNYEVYFYLSVRYADDESWYSNPPEGRRHYGLWGYGCRIIACVDI